MTAREAWAVIYQERAAWYSDVARRCGNAYGHADEAEAYYRKARAIMRVDETA